MTAKGFFRVSLPVPEPAVERPRRDQVLLAARPLWPAMRRFQALLRPGSRARTAWLRQTFPAAFAAINRQDFVLVNSFYRGDAEMRADPEAIQQLGLEPVYYGRDSLRALTEGWNEAFAHWRWEVPLLVDGGNKWVALGEIVTVGAASEIEVRRPIAASTRVRGGQIARQDLHWEWEDALAAFRLPPPDEIPWAEGEEPG